MGTQAAPPGVTRSSTATPPFAPLALMDPCVRSPARARGDNTGGSGSAGPRAPPASPDADARSQSAKRKNARNEKEICFPFFRSYPLLHTKFFTSKVRKCSYVDPAGRTSFCFAFPDHSRTETHSFRCVVFATGGGCVVRRLLLRMKRRDSPPGRAQTSGHGDQTFVTSAP